jgi:hypothetical protein
MALLCSYAQAGEKSALQSTGSFELGFRHVDVNGNEDKYMEDVNYTKGPRLFKLDFNVFPGKRGDQFFDLLNISASNLGGDPYEHFSLSLKKHRKYNFRYTRNRLTYFYKDIIKPLDETTPALSDAGDFHHFNFDHVFHKASFDFRATDRAKVFFNFDRQFKAGENTTTRDVSRDEFELDKPFDTPRDDVKNDYTAGAEIWFDNVSLYLAETYRDYKNNNRIFLPGFSAGEDPEDQSELFAYDQSMPVAYQMPQTTVKANIRPHDRVTVNAGYVFSLLEADLEYRQTTLGISFAGDPIDETITGTGDFERTMHLVDVDGAVDVNEMVALIGAVSYKTFDQDGWLEIEEERTSVSGDFNSIGMDAGATVDLHEMISVTGGVSYEEREVNGFAEEDAENHEDPENTTRTTFFGSATVKPDSRINIFGEYERGVYDNPFTLISPSDYARYKVRLRAKPTPETNIVAVFLRREIENDDSSADLTNNTFSVRGSYKMSPVKVYGAYSRMDIDNEVVNEISPSFGSGYSWESIYEANTDQALAGIGVEAHENLTLGFQALVYTNSGSFELDKKEFSTYALVKCPAGYTLRFGYDREDYDEDAADFDDYDANIFTVGVGYDFKYD